MDYGINADYARTSVESGTSTGDMIAIVMIGIVFLLVMTAVIYIVNSIFLGKVFKKAGLPAWQAWVPLLNSWKMLEIGGKKGYWVLLGFVSTIGSGFIRNTDSENSLVVVAIVAIISLAAILVNLIIYVITVHNINLKLQYGAGMTVCAIFLPLIWVIVLGVSKNQWNDSLGDPRTDRPVVPPAYLQAAPMTQPTSPIQQQTPVVPAPPQQPASPIQPEGQSQPSLPSETNTPSQDESQPAQQ